MIALHLRGIEKLGGVGGGNVEENLLPKPRGIKSILIGPRRGEALSKRALIGEVRLKKQQLRKKRVRGIEMQRGNLREKMTGKGGGGEYSKRPKRKRV